MAEQQHVLAADVDYFVFTVADCLLALPYMHILQIVDSPQCTALPNLPKSVRGVINFMGEAVPLIDTRVKLSLKSRQEEVTEFIDTFLQRKQDHLNWIEALKDAVNNDREIKLERNPHKCKFGQWYDTYRPNSLALTAYMARFNRPHQVVHKLADQAEELVREGRKEQAKELIRAAEEKELKNLVELFDGFEEQMEKSYQEYAAVLSQGERKFSFSFDTIKYFEKLQVVGNEIPLTGDIDNRIIHGVGRRKVGDESEDVLMLDVDRLFDFDISIAE